MEYQGIAHLYAIIHEMTLKQLILSGEVRISLVDHGTKVRVWIGADQIINGKRVKMAPLRNPVTRARIEGEAFIANSDLGCAFERACEQVIKLFTQAAHDHHDLVMHGRPTWGFNYQLPKSTK